LTAVNQNLFQLRFADDRFSPQGVGFQPVDWRIADPGWRLESKVRHGRVSPNPPTFISSGLDHGNVSSRVNRPISAHFHSVCVKFAYFGEDLGEAV
jgi:hypothetical protein